MTPGRALVLVPTYDECDNIGPLIARIRASVPAADVLVIDDASPDGTGKLVAELATTDPHVHLLSRPEKQGLGAAYRAGYGWGMARGYDVFVQMDADGSHAPEQLPDLLAALDAADLVLGSRWVPGGAVVNWPRYREALSRTGNAYTRLLLGLPVRDATGGYRALRRGTVECLELEEVASAGYCFQVDVVHRALRAGCEVVREALWRVTAWGLRRRLGAARDVLSKATGGSMRSEP